MSVIYLVLLICTNTDCSTKEAFIQDTFMGVTQDAYDDCIKPRDVGRSFYSMNVQYAAARVECWDRAQLLANGITVK